MRSTVSSRDVQDRIITSREMAIVTTTEIMTATESAEEEEIIPIRTPIRQVILSVRVRLENVQ